MSQSISHQPQNYKSTRWTQSKNFKPVLPHTKPSTIFTKDKKSHDAWTNEINDYLSLIIIINTINYYLSFTVGITHGTLYLVPYCVFCM